MSFDINNAKGVFATVDAAIEATHKAQVEFYATSDKRKPRSHPDCHSWSSIGGVQKTLQKWFVKKQS